MAQRRHLSSSGSFKQWLASFIAIAITAIFAITFMRRANEWMNADPPPMVQPVSAPFRAGVRATIDAGDTRAEFELSALDFQLEPGQSIDERIPAGPFEGKFVVRFRPMRANIARVGAVLGGGSVIIMRNGAVVLSDYVDDPPKAVLTTVPESFSRAPQELVYIFKTDGTVPARLQAIWQPLEEDVSRPLPMGAP